MKKKQELYVKKQKWTAPKIAAMGHNFLSKY